MNTMKSTYDIVIVGGGHNGLVAAGYLAQVGLSVLILERQSHLGGAAVSQRIFPDYDVRVSKYSYLISLLSSKIIKDLGLNFGTRRRRIGSFTPYERDGVSRGLVLHNESSKITSDSFSQLDSSGNEYRGYERLRFLEEKIAALVWPTLLSPLQSKNDLIGGLKDDDSKIAWRMFIEEPLGVGLEKLVKDDAVRGLLFTDAKIGVFTHPDDPSLIQNKTFLYHIMGNGTGEWWVPVGGMGAFTESLIARVKELGVDVQTDAEVINVDPHTDNVLIDFEHHGHPRVVESRLALINATPPNLHALIGRNDSPTGLGEGSVFKINMLLKKLPRVKAKGISAKTAFTGTFHLDEGYEYMKMSYKSAAKGNILEYLPGEMYCHSLTDNSILSPELVKEGYQTLTLFGLDVPYRLFQKDNEKTKEKILKIYFKTMNKYLEDPVEECFAKNADGSPCVEAKSPVDIENELGMTYGNIFQNQLTWPFAEVEEEIGTWGVETAHANIFLCGAGAKRGGAVSGIPGHNAAMKVMEVLGIE